MRISEDAFDLIVREEITSQAYYTKHYERPEWPGGESGITIAIGYDLGYASRDKIKADWSSLVDPDMLTAMMLCSGIRGAAAQKALATVKSKICIPWMSAIEVFANRDVPQWTAAVLKAIPTATALAPDCLGSVVSIAYNRGASFNLPGDRYIEMRDIKAHIDNRQFIAVEADIRGMKRLWPNVKGLRDRRDAEADLWAKGLKNSSPARADIGPAPAEPDPTIPTKAGPARTKPPATTKTQNGTAGAVIVGGAVVAAKAHAAGLISPELALFGGFLAVLAGVTAWVVWYRNRNPK